MSNKDFPYRTALVTGASSGIGRALCVALSEAGIRRLFLVARNQERLTELEKSLHCETTVLPADLTKEDDLLRVLDEIVHVDLLINNAGFGSFGPFHLTNIEDEVNMLMLNCEIPMRLAHRAMSHMTHAGHGCIVNIASGMAFQPMPYMSTYAASKAFLLHWSEGVATELQGTGAHLVTICPGTIHTGFAAAAGVPVDDIPGSALVTGPIEEVVRDTLHAIRNNTIVAIPGWRHRLVLRLTKFVPRWISRAVSAWAMARTHRKISG